jgi:hypothetical protein
LLRRIADNLLFYNLTIGSKFGEVNELYKINNASLLGLKKYGFGSLNTDFLIHFGGVGPAIKIKKKDSGRAYVQETKTPQIVFDIPSDPALKASLDSLFLGRMQYNYFGQQSNAPIAAVTFSRPYYKSTFKSNTETIVIYPQRQIQNPPGLAGARDARRLQLLPRRPGPQLVGSPTLRQRLSARRLL